MAAKMYDHGTSAHLKTARMAVNLSTARTDSWFWKGKLECHLFWDASPWYSVKRKGVRTTLSEFIGLQGGGNEIKTDGKFPSAMLAYKDLTKSVH